MRVDDVRRELDAAFSRLSDARVPPKRSFPDVVRRHRLRWATAFAVGLVAALVVGVVVVASVLSPRFNKSGAVLGASSSPQAASAVDATAPPESVLPPFACISEGMGSGSGAANPPSVFIVGLSTTARAGYDRLTVGFNRLPTGIGLSTQSNGTFTTLPNRKQVTLAGRNGILVTIEGADSHTNYHGPTQIVTGFSTLKEVRLVEDSGGVVQLGLGIAGPTCYRAVLLNNPDRLLIDVRTG